MRIGSSIFLIALGAILAWAITPGLIPNVDLTLIGYILMAVGVIGLIASLVIASPGQEPPRQRDALRRGSQHGREDHPERKPRQRPLARRGNERAAVNAAGSAGPDLRVGSGAFGFLWFFIDKPT